MTPDEAAAAVALVVGFFGVGLTLGICASLIKGKTS